MYIYVHQTLLLLLLLLFNNPCNTPQNISSSDRQSSSPSTQSQSTPTLVIVVGANRPDTYLHQLRGKKVAVLVNQTSIIQHGHLVDYLLKEGIQIQRIFAPEHGFRGQADAGEQVSNGKDVQTGLPIVSLYGANKKPASKYIQDLDVVIFDIQDVGARFYTYISTMSYMMEACAENNIHFMVFDRPNPNGHYVDGPILQKEFTSFIGLHPIPIVHGMTVGEYAQMVNGERWLKNGIQCPLTIIPLENYTHQTAYDLPIKPSPNLPNARSIALYPSLCFFEGTSLSIGRGTNKQFQIIGHPDLQIQTDFSFTPQAMEGAKHPKLQGKQCKGWDLTPLSLEEVRNQKQLNLDYLIQAYQAFPDKENFFLKNNFINKLAGNADLQQQIKKGWNSTQIRTTWQADLQQFKAIRQQYLLYP